MFNVSGRGNACIIFVEEPLTVANLGVLSSCIGLTETLSPGFIIVSLDRCANCDRAARELLAHAKARLGNRFHIVGSQFSECFAVVSTIEEVLDAA